MSRSGRSIVRPPYPGGLLRCWQIAPHGRRHASLFCFMYLFSVNDDRCGRGKANSHLAAGVTVVDRLDDDRLSCAGGDDDALANLSAEN